MATTRRTAKAAAAPVRRGRPRKAASAAKAAPAKPDVTVYADKVPTDYHKAFARWIVTEVGYDPDTASSKRAAFLRGVSIATLSRASFSNSEYLDEWREKNGVNKRGPKGSKAAVEEETPVRRRRKAAPEPEEIEEIEEIEEDEEDFEEEEEDDEFEEDDDEFEDEEDDEEDDELEDEEDEEDDDFEEEEAPAPRKRAPAKAAKPAPRKVAAKKAAPTKRTARAKAEDDDFIF